MPNKTFFDRIAFFTSSGQILVGLGAACALAALILRREDILTWAAVSVGLGLALIFFREAFRSRLRPKPDLESSQSILSKRRIQWIASAVIILSTAIGILFKAALFYVALAIIVLSIVVALVLGIMTRRHA